CGCGCGCGCGESHSMERAHWRTGKDVVAELEQYKQELESELLELEKQIKSVKGTDTKSV
ncbi:MAG: hypothetical protein M1422_07125, partial [Candidatus Thermoplasmatota archaeon]|nr:hypothetical protein [Candidatus Thermoplasmatota archaeon]